MELDKKTTVIYGGSGAIGSEVARAFAREGAQVFLAGRRLAALESVAAEVGAVGVAVVDVLDEAAVERHVAALRAQAGSVDVCVNAVGIDVGMQGVPLVELSADAYMEPVSAYIRANFVTAKVAARSMRETGAGVIMALSPPMARVPAAQAGPFGISGAAIENMCRQLALELGPDGVRVLCLRLTGIPESAAQLGSHTRQMWARAAQRIGIPFDLLLEQIGAGTATGRPLTVSNVAEVATFLASERSAGMTGTVLNVTAGAVVD